MPDVNHAAIIEAENEGRRTAVLMVQSLVDAGASNEDIKAAFERVEKYATQRLTMLRSQKGKLVPGKNAGRKSA